VDLSLHDQQQQPVALIAVGRPRRDAPLKIVVQVPPNTEVGYPMRLGAEGDDEVVLPFVRCNRDGCFAEFDLYDEALIRRLRTRPADKPARIAWKDFAGGKVTLPFSLTGFAAALDALGRAR
jgi:invasion protein IalB